MSVHPRRVVQFNTEVVGFDNLSDRLEEIFRTRAYRLLLVRVDAEVEFRDVIEALDRASSRTQFQYGLMTERSMPTPAEPSLFMNGMMIVRESGLLWQPKRSTGFPEKE